MHAACAGLAAAAVLALLLVRPLGHVGIAAGIALAGWVSSAWLFRVLRQRGQIALEAATLSRIARIGMATAIMAMALIILLALLTLIVGRPVSTIGQTLTLAILVSAGLATYAASLQRFGIISLRQLATATGLRA